MLLPGFKAYDIRGRYPDIINEGFAYRLGRAFVFLYQAERVVIGYDARLSSPALHAALALGLSDGGATVYTLKLCGTEEVYFQTLHLDCCGGIMLTASHNPKDENGMKLVRRGALPISLESGLRELSNYIRLNGEQLKPPADLLARIEQLKIGDDCWIEQVSERSAYIQKIIRFWDSTTRKEGSASLKIVANPGNGTAGLVLKKLATQLPIEMIIIDGEPDGTFPNGVPNPLLPERRRDTVEAILAHQADFGVAWDGDFDRCFLFDHEGNFIDSSYLIALLIESLSEKDLERAPVVIDSRLVGAAQSAAESAQRELIITGGGHSPMKAAMAKYNALYGGESSGHHYFKHFYNCDSGMIPWILVANLILRKGVKLSSLVKHYQKAHPCSEEVNYPLEGDGATIIAAIQTHYEDEALSIDYCDGLSITFSKWRFNLRSSNTEPLLRLNLETLGDQRLLEKQLQELDQLIHTYL